MSNSQTETRFVPMNKRVAVKRAEEKSSVGSIIIPEAHREKPIFGTVVAVAEGSSLSPGDTVVFTNKYAGIEVLIDGKSLVVVKEEDLLGSYK